MALAPFVNRERELRLIDEAFDALLKQERLLRTPLLELYGVGGIGKTSILKRVEERCEATHLPSIWIDMSRSKQSVSAFSQQMISQLQRHTPIDGQLPEEAAPVAAIKRLLTQGAVVMIFDAVDAASTEQLHILELWLRELVDDDRLFVIFASKKEVSFRQERTVARKLTALPLTALNRETCETYFNQMDGQIEPVVRALIFSWTRGYPLAMSVMAQAVNRGVDPRTEQGSSEMRALLKTEVIERTILRNCSEAQRAIYFPALQLFALPRRFNLVMMQELIEAFAPELKRDTILGYFSVHREINEATHVLNWSMERVGLCVDAPVRTLLLLLVKAEQPDRYFAMHDFLAELNLRLASEVGGSDRMRYLREYLYHIACNTMLPIQDQRIKEIIVQIEQESPDTFLQFSEEFARDEELKEVLGIHLATVQASINTRLKGGG